MDSAVARRDLSFAYGSARFLEAQSIKIRLANTSTELSLRSCRRHYASFKAKFLINVPSAKNSDVGTPKGQYRPIGTDQTQRNSNSNS